MVVSVSIGIVGPGVVGATVIRHVLSQAPYLESVLGAAIRIVGISNSKRMLMCPDGIESDRMIWEQKLLESEQDVNIDQFSQNIVRGNPGGCNIIVDCTASDLVPSAYLALAKRGIHIVTPNKKFGAGPLQRLLDLRDVCSITGSKFMFEATVGAGLPVISTLRSLTETGDKVLKIEGVLSGTLSYIFNTYKRGMAFSDVVSDAKAKGFTEPDPREDLSGQDVARKVTILARECGLPAEMSNLQIESLVPDALASLSSGQEYLRDLPKFDNDMERRASAAEANGQVIRYIGTVDVAAGSASVELTSVGKDHPFANLSGTDNMIVFTTERYRDHPLVIRGPGAGAEVTAAGVFSDIIQVVRSCTH